MNKSINFVFFGTSEFSVVVLETLKTFGLTPSLVVTTPDKPKGRKLIITPPPVKVWATENNIPILQPKKLDSDFIHNLDSSIYDLFLVASYGKIIPKEVLDLMPHKVLNIHPSLLPKLRGAAPIQTAILTENETGVTIMELDAQMDHGPIIAQEKINIPDWPIRADFLEKKLAVAGSLLLHSILPDWLRHKINPVEQNHSVATYTKKIQKEDGLIDLKANPYENYKKFLAYYGWPNTFFFLTKNDKKVRFIITDAEYKGGQFLIKRIIPEGKKETTFDPKVLSSYS